MADLDRHGRRGAPKGAKRERTREALLDAALSLTREVGLEQTTLAGIAARAGMTTGAIYGNFRDRDALFMALAIRQWAPIRPRFAPGGSFRELMDAVADAVIASFPVREPAAPGALAYRAYALRNPGVRAAFGEQMANGLANGEAWIRSLFDADDLPMDPGALVRVINALIEGVTFQRFLTPDLMPDDVVRHAFTALAGPRPGRSPSAGAA